MFRLTKSVDIDFGHHVSGHRGMCINMHGHTWKFELTLESQHLNSMGFVVDFKLLKTAVLEPVHTLLDHSMAFGVDVYQRIGGHLEAIGKVLLRTRDENPGGEAATQKGIEGSLNSAINCWPGGMKIAVFPFNPTSERLAHWFYDLAAERLLVVHPQLRIANARVYETLHPVEAYADYRE